ncbi:claudin-7-B-like isoform X1 [Xiphophorus maculatus]|uniref:claudin-7-B-like isoform X1 n=1 Tax=Xiphophorus maculatus TaxID=8083 RepID=UPI0003B31F7E|nr:claudin-7-B-like isoform X1 [Xiphophorus maculatus]XP_027887947.1 claudin-7-B-like isoform X1 [Xiphophorus couchianus]
MANKGLQILGFALALMGVIGLIVGTILPQWKMSAFVGSNIITAVSMYEGLWMSCAFQSTGQIQCKVYDSMLQLNSALQATRALMVVSIIVVVAGMGAACMGMKCTNCGGDDQVKKAKIAMTGGIIILLGGKKQIPKLKPGPFKTSGNVSNNACSPTALCAIVACSWYANDIVRAFYDPFTPVNTKYEFGSAIFIAWAGSFLGIIGGAMLAASCPREKRSPNYPMSSRPPSNKQDYV